MAGRGVEEGQRKSADQPAKKRVLVVDDNSDIVWTCSTLLRLSGFDVKTASDGPVALEVALAFRPEVVLLDIGLPGMSGYEVASRLRQEECCKDAMIVAVSGYGQEDDLRRSKEAGFDYHLVKPVDHELTLKLLSARRSR